jgi:hypothetical protein
MIREEQKKRTGLSETRAKKQFGVKKTHAAAKLKRRRCKRQ